MADEHDIREGQINDEEDLFDLSLDDLSPEDIEQVPIESEADEEIIELMNLVEKGDKALNEDEIETTKITEDDQPTKGIEDSGDSLEIMSESGDILTDSGDDLDFSDITLDSNLDLGEQSKSEKGIIEELIEDIKPEEFQMEGISSIEDGIADDLIQRDDTDNILEESVPLDEISITLDSPLPAEEEAEPSEEMEIPDELKTLSEQGLPEENEAEDIIPMEEIGTGREEMVTPVPEQAAGISEERLEAMITRIVEDVAARVTRETMTLVAEKFITEAIDSLKKSIESDQEQ